MIRNEMTDLDETDYSSKISTMVELCEEKDRAEFFAMNPTAEEMADVIQNLFEFSDEKHILMTMEAIKRGIVTDLRSHPGRMTGLTIAQIWESTMYAQVLRLAGWKCDKDSDPDGKDFMARTEDMKEKD
jgi:hypothetical protein